MSTFRLIINTEEIKWLFNIPKPLSHPYSPASTPSSLALQTHPFPPPSLLSAPLLSLKFNFYQFCKLGWRWSGWSSGDGSAGSGRTGRGRRLATCYSWWSAIATPSRSKASSWAPLTGTVLPPSSPTVPPRPANSASSPWGPQASAACPGPSKRSNSFLGLFKIRREEKSTGGISANNCTRPARRGTSARANSAGNITPASSSPILRSTPFFMQRTLDWLRGLPVNEPFPADGKEMVEDGQAHRRKERKCNQE